MLKLGYIIDAAGISFVEKRQPVGPVISDRVIENRLVLPVLFMPILCDLDVAGLAVLVRGVVGYIDLLPVVPPFVPLTLESYAVITTDIAQET